MAESDGILNALLALNQRPVNGLLGKDPLGAVTANRNMLAQGILARNRPEFQMKPNTLQGLLDGASLATSPVPILGDLVGLAADGNRFYNEPESRTPLNFGLAALGLLPFVPSVAGAAKKSSDVVFPSVSDSLEKWKLKNQADLSGFNEIAKNGEYRILHKPEIESGVNSGFGQVYAVNKNGDVVGSTYYGPHGGNPSKPNLEGAVEVHPDYRRKGIATSMYDSIEKITGKKLSPADSKTPLADAFWRAREGQ